MELPLQGEPEGALMILSLIVAAAENNVIGKNNQLPWTLPEDMKYFKNVTWAMPVVMGRKTFESLGKPLKGRLNIVITRQKDWNAEGVRVVNDFNEALEWAKKEDMNEVFIIGGAQIYKQSMGQVQRMYITRIHHSFEGDAFFPEFSKDEWKLVNNRDCQPDEKNPFPYSFQVWERTPLTPEGE